MENYSVEQWAASVNAWREAFGKYLFLSVLFLVVGVVAANLVFRLAKKLAAKHEKHAKLILNTGRAVYFLILLWAGIAALHHWGLPYRALFSTLLLAVMVVTAAIMTLKPFIPTLPFKVGNVIMAAGLYGKVEAVSFLNTRINTFDGKIVFVPNSKILKDNIINYHTTPNRRVNLEITIQYTDDLARAKQILVEIMTADERVLKSVAPVVYVLDLADSGVRLGGRCWVPNPKYWKTRSDLYERLKLRIDAEERVNCAFPRQDVRLVGDGAEPASPPAG